MKYFTGDWYKQCKQQLTSEREFFFDDLSSAEINPPEKLLTVSYNFGKNKFTRKGNTNKLWNGFEANNTLSTCHPHASYVQELKGISPLSKEIVIKSLLLHDCLLLEMYENDSFLILRLQEEDTKYNLAFKNYKILSPITNTFDLVWKYEEVYELATGYEYHILFADMCNNPHTFTLFAEKIIIKKES